MPGDYVKFETGLEDIAESVLAVGKNMERRTANNKLIGNVVQTIGRDDTRDAAIDQMLQISLDFAKAGKPEESQHFLDKAMSRTGKIIDGKKEFKGKIAEVTYKKGVINYEKAVNDKAKTEQEKADGMKWLVDADFATIESSKRRERLERGKSLGIALNDPKILFNLRNKIAGEDAARLREERRLGVTSVKSQLSVVREDKRAVISEQKRNTALINKANAAASERPAYGKKAQIEFDTNQAKIITAAQTANDELDLEKFELIKQESELLLKSGETPTKYAQERKMVTDSIQEWMNLGKTFREAAAAVDATLNNPADRKAAGITQGTSLADYRIDYTKPEKK